MEVLTEYFDEKLFKVKSIASTVNEPVCSKPSDKEMSNKISTIVHNTRESTNPAEEEEKEFEARLYFQDEGSDIKIGYLNKDGTNAICYGPLFDVFNMDINESCVNSNGNNVASRGPSVDVKTVFKQDDDGDTLLHIAVTLLSLKLAFYIIDKTPCFSWLNIQNKLFQTPLHLAVLTDQTRLVRRFVVGGADLESRDHDGNTPVHLACRRNRLDCLRALLQPVRYGEQKRNNYDIPFQAIPQNLNSKNYEGLSCLHIAALDNNIEIIKALTAFGANVNEKAEKTGRTILHEAAWSGNLNLVKYLLSLGRQCDINARTYDDYAPFDLARSRGHWSVVMELATAGAKYEDEKDLEV